MADDDGVRTVLVAAEDEQTRTAVSLTLAGDSYAVIEATTAEEAILGVAKHRPALLIVDEHVPGASGIALARSVKAQPETGDAHVIVMYPKGEIVDEDGGRAAGVDEFLAKPFTSLGLLKKVNSVLS